MARIDFNSMPKETKEKIFTDICEEIIAPCSIEGQECPIVKYGIDCDKDNDNHCAYIDFINKCLQVR